MREVVFTAGVIRSGHNVAIGREDTANACGV